MPTPDALLTRADLDAERPIGIFDSGVGGLTVLQAVRRAMPCEHVIYLGDTARVPYGNKAPSTISRYSVGCAELLARREVKAIVVACNTASAFGLQAVVERFAPLPVLGVIDPVARTAAARSDSGRIGVVGTRATVRSEAYVEAITRHRPGARVFQEPCPLFVPLAEEGWLDDPVTQAVAERYLAHFVDTDIDTLILGCTHYPLLRPVVERVLAERLTTRVEVLDSATATTAALAELLEAANLVRRAPEPCDVPVRFLVTDEPERFVATSSGFLGDEVVEHIEHVDIVC